MRAQGWQRRPAYAQDPEKIGFENCLRLFNGHVLDRAAHGEAGIVDHCVEPASLGQNHGDGILNGGFIIDIHGDHFHAAIRLGYAARATKYAPAGRSKSLRAGLADARRGACDQNNSGGRRELIMCSNASRRMEEARRPAEEEEEELSADELGRVRTKRPQRRAQMLAPGELAESPHAQKAMAELIASGRASRFLNDVMDQNGRLARAVSAVLAEHVASRDE
jgi:hypothetical protein